jgi:hypothetical protein
MPGTGLFEEVCVTFTHDRTRYQQGCRCSVCTAANKVYTSEYRQRRRLSGVRVSAVPPLPDQRNDRNAETATVAEVSGPVVSAVQREVELLGVARSHPGLCAVAMAMGAILDRPACVTTQPSAARQLMAVLETLHRVAQPRRGRLAAITTMSSRSPDAG